jgi:hypothetical protein
MPALSVHLIALTENATRPAFLSDLAATSIKPQIVARPYIWLVSPGKSDILLSEDWSLLVVLDSSIMLPSSLDKHVKKITTVHMNEASRPGAASISTSSDETIQIVGTEAPSFPNLERPLISLSGENCALTPALQAYIQSDSCPKGKVSMLNLISYNPQQSAKESYGNYLSAIKAGAFARIGGGFKLYGKAVNSNEWEDVSAFTILSAVSTWRTME